MKFNISLCVLLAAYIGTSSAEVIYQSPFGRDNWQDPLETRSRPTYGQNQPNWRSSLKKSTNSGIYEDTAFIPRNPGALTTPSFPGYKLPPYSTTRGFKVRPPDPEPEPSPDSAWTRGAHQFKNRVAPPTYGSYRSIYGEGGYWRPEDD